MAPQAMGVTPILVKTKNKLGVKFDLAILINQIPKMPSMLTQVQWNQHAITIQSSKTPSLYYTTISQWSPLLYSTYGIRYCSCNYNPTISPQNT